MDSYRSAIGYMEVRPIRQIKMQFFPSSGRVHTTIWMHLMDADYAYREKAWRQLHKDATSCIERILDATPHKAAAVRSHTSHL